MARSAYEHIKSTAQLPSPTGVALQILNLAHDEETSTDAIGAAVEADPAIASRLLKLINSPLAGMPRQIASVSRAVKLLGVRAVTCLALGFSLVSNNRAGPCSAFDYDLFWSDSLARAVAARHLAFHLKGFAPDEAFTCGLLSPIGRLAFATAHPGAYSRILDVLRDDESRELAELEWATFKIDHYELAAELMTDWHLPEVFRGAVRAQADPDNGDFEAGSRTQRFAQILHLCVSIAEVLTHSIVHHGRLADLALEANRLGIGPDVYHDVFDSTSLDWREAGAVFSVKTRHVPPLEEIRRLARERQVALESEAANRCVGGVHTEHADACG